MGWKYWHVNVHFNLHIADGKDVYIYDTFEKKCILVAQTLGCNMADLHNTYDLIIEATNNHQWTFNLYNGF